MTISRLFLLLLLVVILPGKAWGRTVWVYGYVYGVQDDNVLVYSPTDDYLANHDSFYTYWDGEGYYYELEIPVGTRDIIALKPGFQVAGTTVLLTVGDIWLDIVLEPVTTDDRLVTGRAVDCADASGLADSWYQLLSGQWGYGDNDGVFAAAVGGGYNLLEVGADGYQSQVVEISADHYNDSLVNALGPICLSRTREHGALQEVGGSVTVCGTGGEIAAAHVEIEFPRYGYTVAADTGEAGNFSLLLPAGTYSAGVWAAGYHPYFATAVLAGGQFELPGMCLAPFIDSGAIAGTLHDVHGFVPPDAVVRTNDFSHSTRANVFGAFYLEAPAGVGEIVVEAAGYENFTTTINIVPDTVTPLTVTLAPVNPAAIDDHCDELTDCATVLTVNGLAVNGVIEPAGDRDLFRFAAVAGEDYTVRTGELGAGADTVVELYGGDAGRTPVTSNDDGGSRLASELTFTAAEDGWYYIVVRSYDPAATGTYAVRLEGSAAGCEEAGCASLLLPGAAPVGGEIAAPGASDWFRFAVLPGMTYELETVALGPGMDTVLQLYQGDGTELGRDDDSGSGRASKIFFDAWQQEELVVRVSHYDHRQVGVYGITLAAADDHCDAGTDCATVLQPYGEVVSGSLEIDNDADWFRFRALDGIVYKVELVNPASPGNDTVIQLFDDRGLVLQENGGRDQGYFMEWQAPFSAWYWLRVSHAEPLGRGSYTVRLVGGDDHGDDVSRATMLPVNSFLAGRIETTADRDWFRVAIADLSPWTFTLSGPGLQCSQQLTLYLPDSATPLAVDDNSCLNDLRTIHYTPAVPGTLFLEVAQPMAPGDYQIAVEYDDYPDVFGSDAPVVPVNGIAVAGRTETAGDWDWLQVAVDAGGHYLLEARNLSTGGDVILRLVDGNGMLLAEDDDSGGDNNALISFAALESGTCYLRVEQYDPTGTGTFAVRVYAAGGDDHGNSAAAATMLVLNDSTVQFGSLEANSDEDWFGVTLHGGSAYRIVTEMLDDSCDTVLQLFDAGGSLLRWDDDSGLDSGSQIRLSSFQDGLYYLRVRHFETSGRGQYALRVAIIPPDCMAIRSGQVTAEAISEGETDTFCLQLTDPSLVDVYLAGPDQGADLDLYLQRHRIPSLTEYEAGGHTEGGSERAALQIFEASQSTPLTLFINVLGHAGAGSYTISARVTPNVPVCREIGGNASAAGILAASGADLYCLNVAAGDLLTVRLEGPSEGADFDLYVRQGAPAGPQDYDVRGYSRTAVESARIESRQDQVVYIEVRSYAGQGAYTLTTAVDAAYSGSSSRRLPTSQNPGKFTIIKGYIADGITGDPVEPESYCLAIKGGRKYCYDAAAIETGEIAPLPGGYFFLVTAEPLGNTVTIELSGLACHQQPAAATYGVEQLSNVVFAVNQNPLLDCDQDGMTNGWEKQHGLDTWKDDGAMDMDQDGFTNWEEYGSDTDPADKNHRPPGLKAADTTGPIITGLIDDFMPRISKVWRWGATDAGPCTFRYAIDNDSSALPEGEYGPVITATQNYGPGRYYLHVQARDAAGNTSAVKTVSVRIVDSHQPGDVNGDLRVDLADALIVLAIFSGRSVVDRLRTDFVFSPADVPGDGTVGWPEVFFILQQVANLR